MNFWYYLGGYFLFKKLEEIFSDKANRRNGFNDYDGDYYSGLDDDSDLEELRSRVDEMQERLDDSYEISDRYDELQDRLEDLQDRMDDPYQWDGIRDELDDLEDKLDELDEF